MSYRYNTLDVIVGVGMSAIMFGALLLFVATAGTFQGVVSSPAVMDLMSGDPTGMAWLQPPLGQAIVDRDAIGTSRQSELCGSRLRVE